MRTLDYLGMMGVMLSEIVIKISSTDFQLNV